MAEAYSHRFLLALEYLKPNEGWGIFTNKATDKGGPTESGITLTKLKEVAAQLAGHSFDKDQDGDIDVYDLQNLSEDDKEAVYKTFYPDALDLLNSDLLAIKVFDEGANMGLRVSIKILQKAINACLPGNATPIPVDGGIGPITVGVANKLDSTELLQAFVQYTRAHYTAIAQADPVHGAPNLKGWLNRANRIPDLTKLEVALG